MMKSFDFWQKWIFSVSLVLIVFGMLLALFPQSQFMDFVFNNQIDPVFDLDGEISDNMRSFQAWIYGVLGTVISGWGILLAFIARYPFKARQKWAWNCIAAGFVLWFVVDTSISACFGVIFNVLFNVCLLLLIGIPLIGTYKYFRTETRGGHGNH